MTSEEIRALQAPLKSKYKEQPETAMVTLHAEGMAGAEVTFDLQTRHRIVTVGLHPATGGSGKEMCSGDLLLEALAACAGVTLKAVATAMDIHLRSAKFSLMVISIFVEHSVYQKKRLSALKTSGSIFHWKLMQRKKKSPH